MERVAAAYALDLEFSVIGVSADVLEDGLQFLEHADVVVETELGSITKTTAYALTRGVGSSSRSWVRFRWDEGGSGTMTITWRRDLVADLEVAFD